MKTITATIGAGSFKTIITNGTSTVISDEPIPHGKDEGPSPYDYLLTALGACVTMTLRMYADRKKWKLEKVEVNLSQQRVKHDECDDCESTEGFVHLIQKEVKLIGDLDEDQRARLMEVADRCPVHKTLQNEIKIKTVAI